MRVAAEIGVEHILAGRVVTTRNAGCILVSPDDTFLPEKRYSCGQAWPGAAKS